MEEWQEVNGVFDSRKPVRRSNPHALRALPQAPAPKGLRSLVRGASARARAAKQFIRDHWIEMALEATGMIITDVYYELKQAGARSGKRPPR